VTAAVQPDLFEVTDAPAPVSRHARPPHLPSLEERQAAMVTHNARVCVCGHKCSSHGSYAESVFRGIGGGQCGWDDYPAPCPCGRFEVAS